MKETDGILMPHGGYEKLRAYVVAKAIYDATVVFCDRFLDKRSRTHDQMVQAARSGVRNISEGSGAAATSKKTEIKLTNVARASLNDELLQDYRSFLIQRELRIWSKDSHEAMTLRTRLRYDVAPDLSPPKPGVVQLTGLAGLASFVSAADPEIAGNAMLCAINQASYLLRRLLEQQSQAFLSQGGFTENLYSSRKQAQTHSATTNPEAPTCPKCHSPMQQRTAKKGPHSGQPFWGCSQYPNCNAILPLKIE